METIVPGKGGALKNRLALGGGSRRYLGSVLMDGGPILRCIEQGEDEAVLRVLKWEAEREDL